MTKEKKLADLHEWLLELDTGDTNVENNNSASSVALLDLLEDDLYHYNRGINRFFLILRQKVLVLLLLRPKRHPFSLPLEQQQPILRTLMLIILMMRILIWMNQCHYYN